MASNERLKRLSSEDKLNRAKQFKEEGNALHKKQQFKQAIGKYHRALLQLKGIGNEMSGMGSLLSQDDQDSLGFNEKISEETMQQKKELTKDCHNNLAACLLKQSNPNFGKILEYCDKVLEVDVNNVKAHFRRGVALYNLEKYEEALHSFETVEQIDKSFSASLVTRHKQQCREGIRQDEKKLKAAYSGLFSKGETIKKDTNR